MWCSRNRGSPAAALATVLLAALLALSAAAATVPSLFTELPGDEVVAASAIDVAAVFPGVDVVKLAGSDTPALKTTGINRAILAAQPPRLQLDLPNVPQPITARVRRDLSQAPARGPDGSDVAKAASAAAGGFSEAAASPGVWVGEVNGSPGALSTVVLVTSDSGAVWGDIRYYDKKTKAIRSFKIVPDTDRTQVDEAVQAANAAATADLYPKVNPNKYLVVEYREPRGERKYLLPPAQATDTGAVTAAGAAAAGGATVDTTPDVPVKPLTDAPLPGFDALSKPYPTPEELAATKAATAGPSMAEADAAVAAAAFNASTTSDTVQAAAAGSVSAPTLITEVSVSPAGLEATPSGSDTSSGRHRKLLQSTVTQDVLIVYTAAAASSYGGVAAMEAKARENVARTNKAYVDSGINVQLNLVGIRQTTWSEAGRNSSALGDMQAGRITGVHGWRDELGADIVAFFNDISEAGICGWGYIVGTSGGAAWAYSEVLRGCADGNTFAHELGHNQGCGHLSADGGGRTTYAYGWRRCDLGRGNFKTIMAGWCSQASEAGLFATPSRSVSGVPAGNAVTGDCARNIRDTAATVAAYRPTKVTPPPPPPGNGRAITLKNLNANKCVDAPSYNNGARVHVWDCHGGQNQQWELLTDGSVRAVGTNKCLDVAGVSTSNGAAVIVWDCTGGNNQKWFIDYLGRLHPYHAASMCLDVPNGLTNNGNQMQIWGCALNNNNQVFAAPSLGASWSPGGRGIKSRLNNMCIDVFAFTYQNGGPVVMWPCNSQANQQWNTDTAGALRSQHNLNFCLDASANDNGATVYVFTCHWRANQQWFMDPLGRLRPFSNPNRCLDIRGANPAQQTPLQLWDCVDVNQQKWYV